MLNTRSIALQGIGFGSAHTALQGLWPYGDTAGSISGPPFRPHRARRSGARDDLDLVTLMPLILEALDG